MLFRKTSPSTRPYKSPYDYHPPAGFFFDFDGVICDSERAHMIASLEVLKKHTITFSEKYYFKKLFGLDDRLLFKHVFALNKKPLKPHALKAIIRGKNKVFMRLADRHIYQIEGVENLMKSLHAKGIPLCVVSGALKKEVKMCLKKAGLEQYFKFIMAADMVEESKPHPQIYEKAFSEMKKIVPHLKKEDSWVLEDSPAGVTSAKSAGLKVIGITNTTTANQISHADAVVKDYSEIKIARR